MDTASSHVVNEEKRFQIGNFLIYTQEDLSNDDPDLELMQRKKPFKTQLPHHKLVPESNDDSASESEEPEQPPMPKEMSPPVITGPFKQD